MTETDRERIANGSDSEKTYQSVSRVRNRIDNELKTDLVILKENHPGLYHELLEVVDDV